MEVDIITTCYTKGVIKKNKIVGDLAFKWRLKLQGYLNKWSILASTLPQLCRERRQCW